MRLRYSLCIVLFAVLYFTFGVKTKSSSSRHSAMTSEEKLKAKKELFVFKKSRASSSSDQSIRIPASTTKAVIEKDNSPAFVEKIKDEKIFAEERSVFPTIVTETPSAAPVAYEYRNRQVNDTPRFNPTESSKSSSRPSAAKSTGVTVPTSGVNRVVIGAATAPAKTETKTVTTPESSSPSRSTTSTPTSTPTALNCSASLGTGSYNSPQNVTLTCSSVAEISYCLSDNGCCDPDMGNHYTGPILVGAEAKNYCLSYKAKNPSSSYSTSISEVQYTFSPDLPDLQVAHVKTHYQTTELKGLMSVTSQDFGNAHYSMGIINLKSNDPAGMSCDDLYQDYSSFTPLPSVVLAEESLSAYAPSHQLDVFLDSTKLVYGENNLSTYVVNNEFADPILTCSSNTVYLEDFAFFQEHPTQAMVASNNVIEFSGGFSHLGFFEPATTVYRGPAGSSSFQVSSQTLDVGLFGVFY